MGWLLGCFMCAGESRQVKPKKQSSGVATLVSGRASSAAVAHATSPEDLHRVRKSPPNLAVANGNRYVERGRLDSSSASSQSQAKPPEGANLGSKLTGGKSSREILVQQADAAGDEVEDSRNGHRVLQPPPNSMKVTSNKPEKDRNDFAQHSWLVSSLVTRNGGLLFEASSRPSSPFSGLHEHGSLHSRGVQASQSVDFYDNLGTSNALKCVELNTFRLESGASDEYINGNGKSLQPTHSKVEPKAEAAPLKHKVQSPPWTFPEAKFDIANHKSSCLFESSDDLLLGHLDVSSLIEDSALITDWELMSAELHSDKWGLHDQSSHVLGQGGGMLPHFLGGANQNHLGNEGDGDSLDSDANCSMVIFEVPSDDGAGLFAVDEDCCSSTDVPSAAPAPHNASCGKDCLNAVGNMDYDAKAHLLQAEFCTDIEGSDNDASSKSCFSSQFKLSKRLWSSRRRNPFDRDSSTAGHLHDDDDDDDAEVLLPCTHPEMQPLQKSRNSEDRSKEYQQPPLLSEATESSETSNDNRVNYNKSLGVYEGNRFQSSTASFLESLVRRDSVEVFAFEDELVAKGEGDLNAASSLTEEGTSLTGEEDGEQRKKLRLEYSNSFERMQNSMSVVEEDEQVGLSKTTDLEDCHNSSVGATVDVSNGLASSASEHSFDESSPEQTSNLSFTSPSPPRVPKPMANYQSPARLADDRPILGTVAAHWSPIATKKWWDGKGIPNSTNKYKEDQKVSWHAIPFEVRLEQALAKQESALSK